MPEKEEGLVNNDLPQTPILQDNGYKKLFKDKYVGYHTFGLELKNSIPTSCNSTKMDDSDLVSDPVSTDFPLDDGEK